MDRNRDINVRPDGSIGVPDPGNPAPGDSGTFNGYPTGDQTTVHAWWFNMINEELRNQLLAFGIAPVANDVHQFADAFEQGDYPAPANVPGIEQVAPADIVFQDGWYKRVGNIITLQLLVSWDNQAGGLDAVAARVNLPFEVDRTTTWPGTLFVVGSEFLADNALGPDFTVSTIGAGTTAAALTGRSGPGTSSTPIKIGGDGTRTARLELSYPTNGTPSSVWPRVQFDLFGDQPSASTLDLTYFGAQGGDFISVRDGDDIEVQSLAVGATPTDTITTAVLAQGQYTLLHRGFRSHPRTVLAP